MMNFNHKNYEEKKLLQILRHFAQSVEFESISISCIVFGCLKLEGNGWKELNIGQSEHHIHLTVVFNNSKTKCSEQ